MLGSKILEVVKSKYSGELVVKRDLYDTYVTTGILTQTGGEVIKDVWRSFFKTLWWGQGKHKSWLILGLATGTVAKMIADKYSPTKIVGVEIDPQMVYLGKKYFDLDKIPHLKIVRADARKFVANTHQRFDYVLVDMYLGDKLPPFVYHQSFLHQIRKIAGMAVFNHLMYDDDKRKKANGLTQTLDGIFTQIQLRRVLTNVLIICS